MTAALALAPKTSTRLFLGVERSVCGRSWRDRLDERATARALAIAQRHNVPELLARILAGRGVEVDEVEAFLDPTVRRLMPDPHTVTAMEQAALRLADAMVRGEQVAIFGDYDVDGATASALLARFLRHRRHRADRAYPRPDFRRLRPQRRGDPRARRARRDAAGHRRLRHHQHRAAGRGAAARPGRHRHRSSPGRRAAAGRDRGQSQPARRSVGPRPSRRGRPRVHDRGRGQPRAAHARLLDRGAAGAGSARLARHRRARHRRRRGAAQGPQPRLRRQGTAGAAPPRQRRPHRADGRGAARRARRSRFIWASCSVRASTPAAASAAPISARCCFAPTIRSRPGASPPSSTASTASAARWRWRCWRRRRPRRTAALGIEEKGAVVVTAAANWHPGVVGLLAARLKERFNRPAFAIALEPGGTGTGSGRSILGVDLGKTVRRAVAEGLLLKGGGHAMAAGVTVKHGALAEFRAYLESELAEGVAAARADQALLIDGAVSAAGANAALVETIARGRAVRRRQSGAGGGAAQSHRRLCRSGRGGARPRAAALGRRHDAQRHRVPRRRPAARPGADEEPRPGGACRRHAVDRPLERRRARAAAADRCGAAVSPG